MHGFTVPLLTTSSGQKFGKSAGNAVFLSPKRSSAYKMFQHFLQTSDADVGKFLRLFTLLSESDIIEILEEHERVPGIRQAQRRLAEEVTLVTHGSKGLSQAIGISG